MFVFFKTNKKKHTLNAFLISGALVRKQELMVDVPLQHAGL